MNQITEGAVIDENSVRLSYAAGEPVPGTLCPEGSLAYLLQGAAARPQHGVVFVKDDDSELFLTYGEILSRARSRVPALRDTGVSVGAPVLLLFRDSVDFVLNFWACVLGGAVPVPMAYPTSFTQPNNALTKLFGIWTQLDKPLILADADFCTHLSQIQKLVQAEGLRVLCPEDGCDDPGLRITPGREQDAAFIQYSSGSTGAPKGVVLTHRNLLTNIEAMILRLGLHPDHRFLSWMPYNHDMGIIGFHLTPLALAATQINITPFKFVLKPTVWLDKLHEHRCNYTGSPNFGYRLLLERVREEHLARWDLSCVNLIFNGAEPISVPLMRSFMDTLAPCRLASTAMYPVYGMSEACLAVSFPPPGSEPVVHAVDRRALAVEGIVRPAAPGTAGSLLIADEGAPVPSCEIRIVGDDGELLPENVVGHVHIRGPNVTHGYHNNLEATRAAFEGEWLRTGDVGFMCDGRLCVTGRAKDIIFVNGQNFFAHDVEACAEEIEGLQPGRVAACGWHDAELGRERTVIFVGIKPRGTGLTREQICTRLWRHINRTLGIPLDFVVQVKAFPKTTSGKMQRHQLLREFLGGAYIEGTLSADALVQIDSDEVPPVVLRDEEARIRRLWAQVLVRPEAAVPVTAPFLSIGGTSLKAVQILGLLEEEFATALGHDILIRCHTVRDMAAYLQAHLAGRTAQPAHSGAAPSTPGPVADEGIAIIGLSCRFPGADDAREFWQNLVAGRDCVSEVPRSRWDCDRYYAAAEPAPGKTNSRWGGFINDAYSFDAQFFHIDEAEALVMDPQQRLFLETSWKAMESAGYGAAARREGVCVGMFVGASHNDYVEVHRHSLDLLELREFESFKALPAADREALLDEWRARHGEAPPHANTAVDNLLNMIAARTSHALNLKGPSLTVDTACSSSLVAVHLACESLRRGECEIAVAGGVNLNLSPTPYVLFTQAGALSPSGRCKVFDADADGFVPGEGVGVVVLKPLSAARADGDAVLAVIRGSAINNDGRSLGVMAPNPDGQRVVIESVYPRAGVRPNDVDYVEAHGTGTAIGDPSEVRALTVAFGAEPKRDAPCPIGSVKANIGHLLSAAGIASLIKVVLSLHHEMMPPSIHLRRPNPLINFPQTPFRLLTAAEEWPARSGRRRRAAINSFGFGGTNCHMVVEESDSEGPWAASDRPRHLLCMSAPTAEALSRQCDAVARTLDGGSDEPLEDLCRALNAGREHFSHRVAVHGESADGLAELLRTQKAVMAPVAGPPIALMFTGQGTQYAGMGRSLYETSSLFRRHVDECARAFDQHLGLPLLDCLYGGGANDERLARTDLTQPAMFTLDYALGRLLMDWGVQPSCMLGHSVGEYAAACLAGVFSLQDAAAIVAARGRLIAALPAGGGMAAVFASRTELRTLLAPYSGALWFAAHNGLHQVVSGRLDALQNFLEDVRKAGKTARQLRVSHAFHTPLLEPMLDEFQRVLSRVSYAGPSIPIISNQTGEWISERALDPAYWQQHVLAPVCFEQSVRLALGKGITAFVECGPDKVLSGLTRAIAGSDAAKVLPTLERQKANWETLLNTIGELYMLGTPINWAAFHGHGNGASRPLLPPTYAFEPRLYQPSRSAAVHAAASLVPSASLSPRIAVPPMSHGSDEFRDDPQELVRNAVAAQLGVASSQVEPSRNFHELGLNSTGAVQLAAQLSAELQLTLPPTLLFEYQSPSALAEHLAGLLRAQSDSTSIRAPRNGLRYPLAAAPAHIIDDDDIAIVGLACRLPGANNPAEFWELLMSGRSAIREVPSDRWSTADYFAVGGASHTSYSKRGAFLERPHDFDPMFFGISPREAAAMDPQQRLFLEVGWEALQQSGYGGDYRTREIGVFVGCEQNHYGEQFIMFQRYRAVCQRLKAAEWFRMLTPEAQKSAFQSLRDVMQPAELISDAVAGNGLNEIAARVSHWLDLCGPSFVVNTACSSSLVALHLACESLRSGECKLAIVGGVYLTGNDTPFVFLSRVGALSPTGNCAPFDRRADGMVLGEGASAVVVKPLRQAMEDGDFIHAVVKGSAVNNDGHSNGITAPNPKGQADVIRKAYRRCGVDPESISYIECHGTGTPLGDPVELEGMTQAFRSFTDRRGFCAIGSVKSSIGHMLSAASLPSLIKVVLAMQHGVLPPTADYREPNPHIDFDQSPFYVVAGESKLWRSADRRLRAGVNSFGFGGTNCHVVLEQAPQPSQAAVPAPAQPNLLLLNGRTPQVLQRLAERLAAHLKTHPAVSAEDVCATLNGAQRVLATRAGIVASDRDQLLSLLETLAQGGRDPRIVSGRVAAKQSPRVCLIFDGASPFDVAAVEALTQRFPELQKLCNECTSHYERAMSRSNELNQQHLEELLYSFAVQYGLGRMLMSMDITPAAIVAEGAGTVAAACLIGLLSIEQAAALLLRFAQGQREAGDVVSPGGEHSEIWNCPLQIPGAVLRPGSGAAITQLEGYLRAPRRLNANDVAGMSLDDRLSVHVGASDVRERLGAVNSASWVGFDGDSNAVERLFASFARLYVRGLRFNPRPLASQGARRVPLPTYPFEHKTYASPRASLPEVFGLPDEEPPAEMDRRAADDDDLPLPATRCQPPPARGESGVDEARLSMTQRSALADSLLSELAQMAEFAFV